MSFIIVGTNHRYSPIWLREKIFFSKKKLRNAIDFLKGTGASNAGVILSTCNRVEIYSWAATPEIGEDKIKSFISRYYEIDEKDLYPYLYIYKGMDAVRHLFKVASGLDSLILGELQILGQVRAAFYESEKNDFVNHYLSEIFDSAISAANGIHRETGISKGKISIGSVAIDFIRDKIGSFSGKNVLIIGVGKVTELVLKYLEREGSDVIFISNRTFARARLLADRIGAKAVRFDNLEEHLNKADIVITATKSPRYIIEKKNIEEAFNLQPRASSHKGLLIIDLALPRDVDPGVRDMDGIELFDLEDLGAVIQENRERKKIEAQKAGQIIELEVKRLWEGLLGSEQEQAVLR